MSEPLCKACAELCDCGERPHARKCGGCSICWETHHDCDGCELCEDEDDGD